MPSSPASSKITQIASSKLLTAKEVAEQTGLSIETLAQWRSQKRGIQYVKISRNCVRYRQADLDCWLSERIVRTAQDRTEKER
jgi:predicted DNA-binding transcriptional regulator AlpA